ncbi:MAG: glycoside hydrolase [Planctomycetia bacterium]|nr:glycoside hydrolase [Planctomycetia bacterium]
MNKIQYIFIAAFFISGLILTPNLMAQNCEQSKIFPNEENLFGPFQGWGTSLAWWTNSYGNLTEEQRQTIIRAFYDVDDGLGLTIVRYNIGGGDHPDHHHFYSQEAEAPGYLDEKGVWNFDADRVQVQFLKEAIAQGAQTVEVFSNSPPWFMTVSGCTAGAENPSDDNLREDKIDAFADYLTEVVRYLESENIQVDTLSPFNEPNTEFWKKGGGQEGCHYSAEMEIKVLQSVEKKLVEKNLTTQIAAFDDNTFEKAKDNIGRVAEISPETLKLIDQVNVHAYYTQNADDIATFLNDLGKIPVMSELDVAHNIGENPPNQMGSALAFAEKIHDSFRILQPISWSIFTVLPRESSAGPAKDSGYYFLARYIREENRLEFFKKYYAFAQYTKFIRPGYIFIRTDSPRLLAAKEPESGKIVLVLYNEENRDVSYQIHLGQNQKKNQNVQVYRTSPTENLARLDDMQTAESLVSLTAAPYSVTTFIIE